MKMLLLWNFAIPLNCAPKNSIVGSPLPDGEHVDISIRFGRIYLYENPIPISFFNFLDIHRM